MLCILYATALAACLAATGELAQYILPGRAALRWSWVGTLALSLAIPPLYQARHAAALPLPGPGGDAGWWVRIGTLDPLILRLWLAASASLLLWGALHAWGVVRILRRARGGASTVDAVDVLLTDGAGPAAAGLWRPRILLPRWALGLPAAARSYVLRHEDEHRRARDTLLLAATFLAVVVVPWNLAVWWQWRRLRLAVELDCDQRVVRALGNPAGYADLLLAVAEAGNRRTPFQPALLGAGDLERRLRALVAPARLPRALALLAPLLALLLFGAVLGAPHPVVRAQAAPHAHAP